MRIRSIKPEFWRSSDISDLEVEDRLLFVALWSYVDDNGVGVDKLAAITADLFADDIERDAPETFARVSRGLRRLSEAGRIVRYSVEGRDFLYVSNWERHQKIDKPNKPRHPRPDAEIAEIRETVANVRETPSTGTGEQGNRGTGEQTNTCSPAPPSSERATRFDEFWDAYPRKVGKQKARTKYQAAARRADEQTVIDGAYRLARDPNLPESQFVPHPTTWLERDGWEDEPLAPRRLTSSDDRMQATRRVIQNAGQVQDFQNPFDGREIEA